MKTNKTVEVGHTQTPWKLMGREIMAFDGNITVAYVAEINEQKENAAFIVRAVNRIDKYEELLKLAQVRIFMNPGSSDLCKQISEALK